MRITLRQEEASHALKPKYSQLHKTGYWENVQENSIICNQYNHNFAPLQWSFQPEMMANSVTVLVCHDNYKYWIQISYFFIISINTWNMCLLLSSSLCPRFLFLSFDLCGVWFWWWELRSEQRSYSPPSQQLSLFAWLRWLLLWESYFLIHI